MTSTIPSPVRIGDFCFRLFNRPLHPELFEVLSSRQVTRGSCMISVFVTPLGHLIEWKASGVTVVELTAGPDQLLPGRGQLLSHRFDGDHSGQCSLTANLRYRMLSQVERLNETDFEAVQNDLLIDGRKRGLLVCRPTSSRRRLSSLTWIDVTPLVGGLAVTAIHTFPGELAIAKTQSLIEPRPVH